MHYCFLSSLCSPEAPTRCRLHWPGRLSHSMCILFEMKHANIDKLQFFFSISVNYFLINGLNDCCFKANLFFATSTNVSVCWTISVPSFTLIVCALIVRRRTPLNSLLEQLSMIPHYVGLLTAFRFLFSYIVCCLDQLFRMMCLLYTEKFVKQKATFYVSYDVNTSELKH